MPKVIASTGYAQHDGGMIAFRLSGGSYDQRNIEGVIPFANSRQSNGADPLDAAGQSIVQLLHRGSRCRSGQQSKGARRGAETLAASRGRATNKRTQRLRRRLPPKKRTGGPMVHHVYSEIEERFLRQTDNRRAKYIRAQRSWILMGTGHDLRCRRSNRV